MVDTLQPRFGAGAQPQKPSKSSRGLVPIVDFAVGSHLRATLFLLACAALLFLPGFFSIPAIDRDEARFAQATKQMVETGDYVDIRFQDEVRYKKPVGIYWMQAAAVKTASALGLSGAPLRIWVYRIPSLIGAVGAVLLTYWAALAFVTRRGAVFAALMMCSCVVLNGEARLAKTDAMLLLTVVAAMGALGRVYLSWQRGEDSEHPPWSWPAIFWTALAGGILLKGPLILMFAGLAILMLAILDRSATWLWRLRPVWGLMWMLVLVLPWFIAIFWRAGEAFFTDSLGGDMLAKLAAQESHGAPPGFYLLLFWITFWPGAPLAGMAVPAVWRARREPGAQYLLAWLVPSWIVFELVVTKLPHYVLPLYPAIAILIAGVVDARALSRKPILVWGTIWWFVAPLMAGLAGIIALAVIGRQFGLLVWPLIGGATVMGFLAWRLYEADGAEHALMRGAAAALLTGIAIFALILPSLAQLFPSPQLARILRDSGCSEPVAAAVGYQEPSLVFLAGTNTRLTDGGGAADFLRAGECRFAFVEARQERSFAQRAEAVGLRYTAGPRIEAINISNGQAVTIAVFRSVGSS
jgi:4-amino-4-deoxy-L-arabinose transferase-like glycosyltransferase